MRPEPRLARGQDILGAAAGGGQTERADLRLAPASPPGGRHARGQGSVRAAARQLHAGTGVGECHGLHGGSPRRQCGASPAGPHPHSGGLVNEPVRMRSAYSEGVPDKYTIIATWASVGGVIVTLVAAIITAWNAVISRGLLEETKNIRLSQIEPNVYFRLATMPRNTHSDIAVMIIENTGPGIALGLRLRLLGEEFDYEILSGRRLSDLRPFKEMIGIKPGEKFTSVAMVIHRGIDPFDGRPNQNVLMEMTYSDQIGREYRVPIDMTRDPWDGHVDIGYTVKGKTQDATLLDVANEILALRELLERREL